ncbi:MAG: GNAT family N-acetyltransferase [Oscillochloris sp.]|nr:GNAT family N-acetyltransferase [Oscillochloris sp.]
MVHASEDVSVPLTTRSGRRLMVRKLRSDDTERLVQLFYALSSESRYRRFFAPLDHVDPQMVHREARRLARIDPECEAALAAVEQTPDGEAIVAVARYKQLEESAEGAEASIVVRDDYQGDGVGGQLFDLLVQMALTTGMRHLILLTHADNQGLIGLVRRTGMPYRGAYTSGLYEIDMPLIDGITPYFPYSGRTVS